MHLFKLELMNDSLGRVLRTDRVEPHSKTNKGNKYGSY
jgi:hypothetical protein